MNESITGLSAGTLDYIVLALAILSPIVGFLVKRAGGKLWGYVGVGFELLRSQVVRQRDLQLKVEKQKELPPVPPVPPEETPDK